MDYHEYFNNDVDQFNHGLVIVNANSRVHYRTRKINEDDDVLKAIRYFLWCINGKTKRHILFML